MFILNVKDIKSDVLACGKKLADYILERNLPILSRSGDTHYFSYTDMLKEIIELLPLDLREEAFSIE